MKFLILLTFVFIVHSYAQDGYHVENKPSCNDSNSTCLIIDGEEVQLIEIQDRTGMTIGETLNRKSALSSLSADQNICFKNNNEKVCDILSAMAGVDERDYYQGGHILIEDFSCNKESGKVTFTEVIEWTPIYRDTRSFEIKECE